MMKISEENILRKRMHGLYLSRSCEDIVTLAHELLGLHSWFYRNVPFSAIIRGADITGWKTTLTKTWLYRGTLHGVPYDDLPQLLALHTRDSYLEQHFGQEAVAAFADEVVQYMEDGVFSRTEFRRIFADRYDASWIDMMFSPWGGIFVYLARQGKVAFRDMTSRDFDLISAEPSQTFDEAFPELLERYFTVYGPATLSDAASFFGLSKPDTAKLNQLPMDGYHCTEIGKRRYYDGGGEAAADIPELMLLSGFDPYIVSYAERSAVLPAEHKSKVILKSGICNPTIAVNGRVAGIWNIKKKEPVVEFFETQPKRIVSSAQEMVEAIRWRMG